MRGLRAVVKYQNFFAQVEGRSLPQFFWTAIGTFRHCTIVDGDTAITDKIIGIYNNCEGKLWTINPVIPHYLTRYAIDLAKRLEQKEQKIRKWQYHQIIPKTLKASVFRDVTLGERINEKGERWRDLLNKNVFIRTIDEHTPFVLVTESEGLVMFYNKEEGKRCPDQAMYGREAEFITWCKSLYEYYHDSPEPID
jgi:predicted transcriptional regulator